MSKKKSKVKKPILLAIGVVVITGVFAIVWRGQANKSPKILSEAMAKLSQADTVNIETSLQINLPERIRDKKRPLTSIAINLAGDVKKKDGYPESAGTLQLAAKGPGNAFFANGDFRIFNDATAFKLDEFPALLNPSGSLTEKWTYVPSILLATGNSGEIQAALSALPSIMSYKNKDGSNGWWRWQGVPTAEIEEQLANSFRFSISGNQGLNVLARLLQANNIDNLEAWIDPGGRQLRQVRAHFVRPLADGSSFDFATWTLTLQDYGQAVEINRPDKELTVRPQAFAKIFGEGKVEEIK